MNFIKYLRALSNEASCLSNINNNLPDYVNNADASETGQIWNLNEQCKTLYGSSSYFCQVIKKEIRKYKLQKFLIFSLQKKMFVANFIAKRT